MPDPRVQGRILAGVLLLLPTLLGGGGADPSPLSPEGTLVVCVDDTEVCAEQDLSAASEAAAAAVSVVAGAVPNTGASFLFHAHVDVKAKVAGEHVHVHASTQATYEEEASQAEDPKVPCSDPRGCPDLLVDPSTMLQSVFSETRTFSDTSCAVLENSTVAGTRRLLRFTFTTPNLGDGDLIIGAPADNLDWFVWGSCHGHYHFREYADYRLWTPQGYALWQAVRALHPGRPASEIFADHPDLTDGYLAGHKQGFCVIDIRSYPPVASPPSPAKYDDCATNQGISVLWADEYVRGLTGQWIDITGLALGPYVLEAEVNPERFYEEKSFENNAAAILVRIQ